MKKWTFILCIISVSCASSKEEVIAQVGNVKTYQTYLALGDSYTIGTSVEALKAYPYQLRDSLKGMGTDSLAVTIVAKNGWRTDDLKRGIINTNLDSTYDLVSLLIGVNNQYQGKSVNTYVPEFKDLLDSSIRYAGGNKDKVFVLSIPDYGYTPFGRASKTQISKEIDQYNFVADSICKANNVAFYNITSISREAEQKPSYVAHDSLHPSAQQYSQWVSLIAKQVKVKLD